MEKLHFYSKRYREILKVLVKHGFGFLILQLGLEHLIPSYRSQNEPLTQPQHLRAAFEELGTTFIKLGQILSTHSDLLPQAYIEDLSKLQSSVPPLSFNEISSVIEEDYGENWRLPFSCFDETPIASASIGQVYRAILENGDHVIVKVQRPDIENTIKEDLEIITNLAGLAQKRLRLGEVVNFNDLIRQFGTSLLNEMDYIQEAKNIERFTRNFRGNDKLYIPKVYWTLTKKRIITLEEIDGYNVDAIAELRDSSIDGKRLARDSAGILMKMIFEDGFFHGDLHPGNVFIKREGIIALIDFGLVGELDERSRSQMISLFLALSEKDESKMADVLTDLDRDKNRHVHRETLKQDLKDFIDKYFHKTLAELNLSEAMQYLLDIIYRNRVQVPGHLSLLAKTIMMSEGIGRRLDPEFNLAEFLADYAPRLYFQKLHSDQKEKVRKTAVDVYALSSEGPNLLLSILRKVNENELEMKLGVQQTERLIKEFNKMFNRLIQGIITAAVIISMSLVMTVNKVPDWFSAAGTGLFMILGAGTCWSIWRSYKKK